MGDQILTSFAEYSDSDGKAYNPSPTPVAHVYDGDVTDGSYISSMTVNKVKDGVYRAIYLSSEKFNAITHWYTTDTDVKQDVHTLYSKWDQDTIDSIDEISGSMSSLALEETLTAIKGAGWSDETLVAIKTAIDNVASGSGVTAEEVWTYCYRTLTSNAISTTEPTISSTPKDMYTHSSNTITVPCADADEVWFTLKEFKNQPDSESMLQISKTGSLLYYNGKSASDAGLDETYGSLTISSGKANIFVSGSAAPVLLGNGEKQFPAEVKRRMNTGESPIVSQFPIDVHIGLTQAL